MRHFTRADVEQITMKTHPPANGETVEILGVALLTPVTEEFPPVWLVEYKQVSRFGRVHEGADMLIEKEYDGKWYLWYLIREKLPTGCSAPEEEDRIIEAEKAEAKARRQRATIKAVQP